MKNIRKYLPTILIIAGQSLLAWSIIKDVMLVAIFGMVLSGIGAGFWAKRAGRSVFAWFSLAAFVPFFGSAISLVVMLVQERKSVDTQRPVNMYIHMLIAFILFFVGSIAFDSIGFVITGFVITIIWVAKRGEGKYTRKVKLIVIGIYVLMLVMAFVMKSVNNLVSYKNAGVIITACEQYKNKNGVYPAKLDDLVPGYLAEIPPARYTISGEFRYYHHKGLSEEEDYKLMFIAESPFARRVYDFKSKNWYSFD